MKNYLKGYLLVKPVRCVPVRQNDGSYYGTFSSASQKNTPDKSLFLSKGEDFYNKIKDDNQNDENKTLKKVNKFINKVY